MGVPAGTPREGCWEGVLAGTVVLWCFAAGLLDLLLFAMVEVLRRPFYVLRLSGVLQRFLSFYEGRRTFNGRWANARLPSRAGKQVEGDGEHACDMFWIRARVEQSLNHRHLLRLVFLTGHELFGYEVTLGAHASAVGSASLLSHAQPRLRIVRRLSLVSGEHIGWQDGNAHGVEIVDHH
jgi:hypothetical protein